MLLDRSNFPRGIVIHGLRIRVLKEKKKREKKNKENQAFPFCFQSPLVRKHPKSKTLRKLHKA